MSSIAPSYTWSHVVVCGDVEMDMEMVKKTHP